MKNLILQLEQLRDDIVSIEQGYVAFAGCPHPNHVESQRNLLHYIALRSRDLRPLQHELAVLGLSSLGRMESHVLASLEAVVAALHSLDGQTTRRLKPESDHHLNFELGSHLLEQHGRDLLGPAPPRRTVRIMVTLPSEAEHDYTLIHSLLQQGMDVARINCAHDGPAVWEHMIRHIRRAEKAEGRACRILMDLGGPKLRTGPIEAGPSVVKVRPKRNALGTVVHSARIWITSAKQPRHPPTEADALLPVSSAWIAGLSRGDRICFKDARGTRRHMTVIDVTSEGCWAEISHTAYITPGISLRRRTEHGGRNEGTIGDFSPGPGYIDLVTGDTLILTRHLRPGHQATRDSAGATLNPACIGCTLPEIFDDVQTGERVWLDDGKIGGTIENVEADRIFIRITQAKIEGEKLRSDKGINLPDSALKLPALTKKDLADLEFVAAHADMVGLSFAQSAVDVEMLLERLHQLNSKDLGIILKIETRRGFEQLPAMLLAGMKTSSIGVMIARGDLAVECGFERMAEVQEEILWICEAAHCPVIWATQVLESLAKTGIPSRAEITDAAMGHRAEAVMLNKGPHILRAVQTLDDILQRMEAHQTKKQSMMRELNLASTFMNGLPEPKRFPVKASA